jgi:hypothetical protein
MRFDQHLLMSFTAIRCTAQVFTWTIHHEWHSQCHCLLLLNALYILPNFYHYIWCTEMAGWSDGWCSTSSALQPSWESRSCGEYMINAWAHKPYLTSSRLQLITVYKPK